MELAIIEESQKKFELACNEASNISLMQNAGVAFKAVTIVKNLRDVLTDEIMDAVFMPLMNTKIGYLTDRNGKLNKQGKVLPLYTIDIVRDAIIDAASFGLLPTFNQFNIISEKMYPTKEGYSALLKKLGVKHVMTFGPDESKDNAKFAQISVKINYEYNKEKNSFIVMTLVPKTQYSSYDQSKGKAERRAKKILYEYVTGLDLGDAESDDYIEIESRTVKDNNVENQEDNKTKKIKI